MSRKFSELEATMPPASRKRAKARAQRMLAELLLPEIRRLSGLTQVELARVLGIKQPTLSRLEAQDDMQVSTLKRIIEALGGQLDVVIHLPTGDYRLGQFSRGAQVAETANPIIEEIHRIREAHAKRFNYDIDAICEDLRRRQAGRKNLATLQPVKPRHVQQVAEAPAPYAAKRPKAKAGKRQA